MTTVHHAQIVNWANLKLINAFQMPIVYVWSATHRCGVLLAPVRASVDHVFQGISILRMVITMLTIFAQFAGHVALMSSKLEHVKPMLTESVAGAQQSIEIQLPPLTRVATAPVGTLMLLLQPMEGLLLAKHARRVEWVNIK